MNESLLKRQQPMLQTILAVFFAASLFAHALNLERSADGRYSLEAKEDTLEAILSAISDAESFPLKFYAEPGRVITATYRNLSLDQLLNRLGVGYVLRYERRDSEHHLSYGAVFSSDAAGRTPEVLARIEKAIADLHDDNIQGNAIKALWLLCSLGCVAVPELEQALYSTDFQARHIAADLLRCCCPGLQPSDKLLDVTFELLASTDTPYEYRWLVSWDHGFSFLRCATNSYSRFRPRLIENLRSPNPKERLLSAILLAEHQESALTETIFSILAPHLKDNFMADDAGISAHALYRLGPAVRPYVTSLLKSEDSQQADLARLILYQLDNPSSTNARPANPYFNSYVSNPVIEAVFPAVRKWDLWMFPNELGEYRPPP